MSRTTIAIAALGIVASFWLLESAFSKSDHRKAQELVRGYAQGRLSLEQFLADRHGAGSLVWSSDIVSSFRGTMRVHCRVARSAAGYEFDVDLSRGALKAADDTTRALMAEFLQDGRALNFAR